MLLVGEESWIFILLLSWTQSCQWDNHTFLGQPAPQESTYVPVTHHCWDRLDSSP